MAPDRDPSFPSHRTYRYILPYPDPQILQSDTSHETPRERHNRQQREYYARSIRQLRSQEERCNRITASRRINRQVSRSKNKAVEEALAYNAQLELGESVKAR